MKQMKTWLCDCYVTWRAHVRVRKELRMGRWLGKESDRHIQVKVWRSKLYICYDGIPLIEESDLNCGSIVVAIELMRGNWMFYAKEKARK